MYSLFNLVFAEQISNTENEKLTLTCIDGPCNKINLNGFECSYTKINDHYKYICLSEDNLSLNNYKINNYFSNMKFNNFLVYYVLFLIISSLILIQIKMFYKFINFLIKV